MAQYANYLKLDFVTHTRKVQSLFKRIARNEESFHREPAEIKYVWATVRAEFDKHRNVRDMRTAKLLLEEGERKLWLHHHPKPKAFIFSPNGIMFEREHIFNDGHLDQWHPLEKAQYPYYFERREQRKKEFIEMWEKDQAKQKEEKEEKKKAQDSKANDSKAKESKSKKH